MLPLRYFIFLDNGKFKMTGKIESILNAAVGVVLNTTQAGEVINWLYDEATGVATNRGYADGHGPRYEYDANGRLAKRTWARGVETFYAYDGWGNLTNTTYSDDTPTIALCYDAMGRQVEAHDAAGVTTFTYDDYGALTNETVIGVAGTNVIERFYDTFGRNAGYALNGVRLTTLAYDPATGRLVSMSVPTGEEESNHSTPTPPTYTYFTWTYHPGSDLKQSLAYPNGLTASWTYDANNQLLQVKNATPSATISQYDYTYDAAGRRIAQSHSGAAFAQSDTIGYAYNAKSELTNAVAVADAAYTYSYDFDEIGNRRTSSECGVRCAEYAANELNQYTAISTDTSALFVSPRETFTPLFDADGNQTLVKTATGIWQVTYNGENRPILWTCGETNIVMSYDRMGRRVTKSAECGGQSAECCRFVYDGYLQIANHLSTPTLSTVALAQVETSTCNYFIWDPTEPIATRPLVWFNSALDTPHSALYYTHDGNKNVSEVIEDNGDIAAHYEYAPFGAVTAQSGDSAANPWRFSSEFADDELGCDYYNYREYEPVTGRWMSRDPSNGSVLWPYLFCLNASPNGFDYAGLVDCPINQFFDKPPISEKAIDLFVEVESKELFASSESVRYRVDFIARFSKPWESTPPDNGRDDFHNALGGHNRQYVPSSQGDLDSSYWGYPELISEQKSVIGILLSQEFNYPKKKFTYGYALYCIKDSETEWRLVRTNLDMYSTWYKGVARALCEDDMVLIHDVEKCEECVLQYGDKGRNNQKVLTLRGPK